MTDVDPDQYPIMAAITPARTLAELRIRAEWQFYEFMVQNYAKWTDEFLANNCSAAEIQDALERHLPVLEQARQTFLEMAESLWKRQRHTLH